MTSRNSKAHPVFAAEIALSILCAEPLINDRGRGFCRVGSKRIRMRRSFCSWNGREGLRITTDNIAACTRATAVWTQSNQLVQMNTSRTVCSGTLSTAVQCDDVIGTPSDNSQANWACRDGAVVASLRMRRHRGRSTAQGWQTASASRLKFIGTPGETGIGGRDVEQIGPQKQASGQGSIHVACRLPHQPPLTNAQAAARASLRNNCLGLW